MDKIVADLEQGVRPWMWPCDAEGVKRTSNEAVVVVFRPRPRQIAGPDIAAAAE
jgi:hypothetical protein